MAATTVVAFSVGVVVVRDNVVIVDVAVDVVAVRDNVVLVAGAGAAVVAVRDKVVLLVDVVVVGYNVVPVVLVFALNA